jgi:hypothetical protein
MKILKEDSLFGVAVQELEELMHQHGMVIEVNHSGGISIVFPEAALTLEIRDTNDLQYSSKFPRELESEKLIMQ